ncbi:SET domain-containing protein SmydA-8 isoform X1 [Neocloeon triangulifer]|uniref:SET domain-containing protein SmydA-8 isoform X1 n=1 Tax=Neocloeon triangulifer TaxID=2078957 RepID=UPI00286F6157|nr:SET domain-containing protein SmydA-8 isoform X1 [Neocloeon triangulifer]
MKPEQVAYEIKQNDKVGRYVVAAKELEAGEEFLVDTAAVIGPKHHTPPVCLGCLSLTSGDTLCERCGWPVCGPSCADLPAHKEAECAVFAAANVKFSSSVEDPTADCPQYECITPLRLLLTIGSKIWNDKIEKMECHSKERKGGVDWNADQINIVNFLRGPCKLADRFSEEQIHQVCGILAVNTFEACSRVSGGNPVRALYPQFALLSHNCVPNTAHSIGADYKVRVRTTVPVKKGDELFITYTHTLQPTYARRQHLKLSKYFDCECARCADPEELGSNLSTIKCPKCEWGWVRAEKPLDDASDYKCHKCEYKMSNADTMKVMGVIQREIEALDPADLEVREQLIKKYHAFLHPKHAHLTALKHSLCQLYGRVAEYTFEEMPDLLMERKIELCKHMLQIADIVQPGYSRLRGMILYELHAPLIMLARSLYQQDVLTGFALLTRMQEAERVLAEAVHILSFEDPDSMEGQLAAQARFSLEQLQQTIIMLPQQIDIMDGEQHIGG